MSTMDGYRKGWATRYLREAKAELTAAKNTPYLAAGFMMEALTKAQAAIYYSLGDPAFIVPIVHETLNTKQNVNDPILNFLVEIEKTLQQLAQSPTADNQKTMEQVADIIEFTSEIVELFGGKSA
ncbi:MAG: hypothetical protein CW691_01265 [Candidatus Bathyarchaeum sp.]|nr:MAG: hypothetical protein CW691_01265 [Candidatus Bathyarchaeum sp.]